MVFPIGFAMRRAVGFIALLLLFTLSACGNKAGLYLPSPEKDPRQDSKSTPRQ
jgi:predicted small lipoprotein YifL